jgi:hypothetical protein
MVAYQRFLEDVRSWFVDSDRLRQKLFPYDLDQFGVEGLLVRHQQFVEVSLAVEKEVQTIINDPKLDFKVVYSALMFVKVPLYGSFPFELVDEVQSRHAILLARKFPLLDPKKYSR